jgi:hypothetical protein
MSCNASGAEWLRCVASVPVAAAFDPDEELFGEGCVTTSPFGYTDRLRNSVTSACLGKMSPEFSVLSSPQGGGY